MPLTYAQDTTDTIKRDSQRLAEIDAAISSAFVAIEQINSTGIQEYTMIGSRQIRRATMADLTALIGQLEKLRLRYEKRIYMAKGFTGRNNADLSGGSAQSGGSLE